MIKVKTDRMTLVLENNCCSAVSAGRRFRARIQGRRSREHGAGILFLGEFRTSHAVVASPTPSYGFLNENPESNVHGILLP